MDGGGGNTILFDTHREWGRKGGVKSGSKDFIRDEREEDGGRNEGGRGSTRLPFDDTSRRGRGGQGSYVAGESSLTCCCCCCWLCGRCGLTNRSMAVADAEPPPPMIPVASGGPSGFESILATSRDFRFSSFKKAHVDMCQPFSSASSSINNHRRFNTLNHSNTSQQRRDLFFRLCLPFIPLFSFLIIPLRSRNIFSFLAVRGIKRSVFIEENLERSRVFILDFCCLFRWL